jgi:DNA-binding response OmpR family regulator
MLSTIQEIENTIVEPSGMDLDESLKKNKRILIIDDDADTVELLKRILRLADFDVASARNGLEAPTIAEKINPDVVLLDLMMPEMDGRDTLRNLRKVTKAPVIVVSALSSKETVVDLLNMGSDDYLTKPFHRDELIARIQAVLRRTHNKPLIDGVSIPEIGLIVNFSKREVQFQGVYVHLSPKEFDLLALITKRMPHVVHYHEMAEELWGEDEGDVKNRIKYLVHLMRKKFIEIAPDIEVIITVDRFGYRIRTE